jgi:predicted nucleotidyltransferase component of viral defense system
LPPKEIILNEIARESRGHFNIIHHETGFKADIYLSGNEEFQKWALENTIQIDFYGSKLPIAPLEYVIIKKLIFYREGKAQKHLNDIKAILEQSKDLIDFKILKKCLKQFELNDEWDLCS